MKRQPHRRSLLTSCRGGLHLLLPHGEGLDADRLRHRRREEGPLARGRVPLRAGRPPRTPNNARAHNNLAVALEASGDFAQALAEYKKALELEPNNNYIRRNYARFAEFYTSYTKTTGKASGAP